MFIYHGFFFFFVLLDQGQGRGPSVPGIKSGVFVFLLVGWLVGWLAHQVYGMQYGICISLVSGINTYIHIHTQRRREAVGN